MLDPISSNAIDTNAEAKRAAQNGQVAEVNQQSRQVAPEQLQAALSDVILNVSEEAKARYQALEPVLKLARQAMRMDAGTQPERVNELKAMFQSGQIGDYLAGLNPQSLADSLLGSPTGSFLRQGT